MKLSISESSRPQNLDELVGLTHIKNIIKYSIEGSQKLNEPPPSFCIFGPPGCSKTTVAKIIGRCNGGNFIEMMGDSIRNASDVEQLASTCQDKDTIFIEEAHGLPKAGQLPLLTWLEEFKLYTDSGPVDCPKTTFVFSSTNAGKLCRPLRERCKTLQTSFFTIDEIKTILVKAGLKLDLNLSSDLEGLTLLAQSSRGTPRVAILHRLDLLRKVMAVENMPYNFSTVQFMLDKNNINEYGLESNDIKYCETLYDKLSENNKRPVSKKIICQCTGFEEDVVDIIESYLQQISAIRVGTQGRILTPLGCEILDRPPLIISNVEASKVTAIDMERLKIMIQDPDIRRQGMRRVASEFNLKYGPDNAIIKIALEKIGATAKRRAGIVLH